ncbi:hypothetical protein SAMN05421797_10314 [Maribacter ulvicola]|uniref:Uncharacterized protein n=2 Tax=Maribacter ulvicola TaxID=228959 RepID=A0A1N6V6X2_9FLAO|nr:hypothetical protein SAMN05421797_10314 [Maribacter ulvicola]
MVLAIIYDWNWFWALIVALGLLNVIVTGEIHFVESIKKKDAPLMYWLMVAVWTVLTALTLLT